VSTIRSQIVAAAIAALGGAEAPDGLTVTTRKGEPTADSALPVTQVGRRAEKVSAPPGKLRYPVRERFLTLQLDHWAKGEDAEEELETQLAWATEAIQNDPTLGGLVIEVEEDETEWDMTVADEGLARASQRFTARYTTKTLDQEQKQ
jgi:hypothetical protein